MMMMMVFGWGEWSRPERKAGISLLSTIQGAGDQPCTTDDDDFDKSK